MLKNTLLRSVALGASAVLAAGTVAIVGAGSAEAAVLGSLTLTPASGNGTSLISLTTDGPCPAAAAAMRANWYGGNLPAGGINIVPTTTANYSETAPITTPFQSTWGVAAQVAGVSQLNGTYNLSLYCTNNFGTTVIDQYDTTVTFVGSPGDPLGATYVQNVAAVNTTTILAATPASPVDEGTPVDLTATVAPASGPAVNAGSVEFFNGATSLGTAPVSAGAATLSGQILPVGNLSLTAVFTGTGFNTSTSAAVPFVVNDVPAEATTTSLAVAPSGTAALGDSVTLTATVGPAAAAGAVQFKNGAANVGAPVAVSGGTATLSTTNLPAGTLSLTAQFIPTNPALYVGSTSAAVPYEITFSGVSATQDIQVEIAAGALSISVADPTPVVLETPTLIPSGAYLLSPYSAPQNRLKDITVVDTRAGNPGFTVSGQVSDFIGTAGGINGGNLGWIPEVVSQAAAQTVVAGPTVNPNDGIAVGAPGDPALGLAISRTLASAAAGAGNGTAVLSADLELHAPTSTLAGLYEATLTLTAI